MFLTGHKGYGKRHSREILLSINSLLEIGKSIVESFDILQQAENNKNTKKFYQAILFALKVKNRELHEIMFAYGVVSKTEELILKYGKNVKLSIKRIINLRKYSSLFEATILSITWKILLAPYVGAGLAYFFRKNIWAMFSDISEQLSLMNSNFDKNSVDLPVWVFHPEYVTYFVAGYTTTLILISVVYYYYNRYKPYILYKYWSYKAYDEMPVLFTMLYSFHETGIEGIKIMQMLKKTISREGWQLLFNNFYLNLQRNNKLYRVMENFNFPKDVTIVVKSSEVSNNFWNTLRELVEYSKSKSENNNEKLKRASTILGVLSYLPIIYIVVQFFMSIMTIEDLAQTMQQ